jgi:dCTP deaminase
MLSDTSIKRKVTNDEITIEPYEPTNVQPTGVDLRIGDRFLRYTNQGGEIDLRGEPTHKTTTRRVRPDEGYCLDPGEFALATTVERIELPREVGAITQDRSSVGRLGLVVQTAGYVEPGFEGELTLELFNANKRPIRVYPGTRVCQLILLEADKVPDRAYGEKFDSKYQGQTGPTPSRVDQDHDHDKR